MSQFPTEEEEFELMYNDELEMLDENNDNEMLNIEEPLPKELLEMAGGTSESFTNKTLSNVQCHTNDQSLLSSPHLSQISFGSVSQISNFHHSAVVNRKLFQTPSTANARKRVASTPFHKEKYVLPITEEEYQIEDSLGRNEATSDPLLEIQNIGLNRKRKLEELFGDIYDLESDENDQEVKKMKSEETHDLELIDKILEARKKTRETMNPLKKDHIEKLNALHSFKMRNLSYSVPNWPCIPLERTDGERLYVRFHSENYESQHIDEINCLTKGYKGLLGESKEEIWNAARDITLKRLTNQPESVESETARNNELIRNLNDQLWVDKYKPKRYIDLLSDESTNRSLLYWLKMWDKIVFGREFKTNNLNNSNPTGQLNSFNKRTGKFESKGGWNRRVKQNLNTDQDEYGRPIQKIALLCGPPGLGKTTLAHTIARHAGYSIREMNASDDRNPEAFRLALENGTQMQSVLNVDKKPNCIILDEIDGAPSQSIDFLIRFISDNYTSKAKKIVAGQKPKKSILRRPIICICNDMYAPALRQLRQIAFVVNFPPIESSRLAERLSDIAYRERFETDLSSLLALAEKSGNDVRSCISMMQFYSANKKRLALNDVLNSNLGQKDRHRGLFGVWSAIFQIQRPRRQLEIESNSTNNMNAKPSCTMTNMSISTRVKHILEVVHMGGDYERLTQGVYENYLHQKMPDPNLNGIVEALNWFCFSDLLQYQISHLQNYTVYPYLQFGFITWHLLFASLAWPKINFPNKGFEVYQKTTTTKMIFQALRKGLTCNSVGIGQGKVILIETVPILKKILSPTLRSVSLQLLSQRERYDLTHTVEVMADLGLAFTQTKAIDGTYQYSIEPNIDLLCKFQDTQGINLSYFGRQLIAREVELEQMRRVAPKSITNFKNITNVKSRVVGPKANSPSEKNLPNHLQALKPKIRENTKTKEVVTKDFFGRISNKVVAASSKDGAVDPIVKSPIWYKYKEGFNNAVRKDVFISDIL